MLGDQPWAQPDTYDVFNTGARLDHTSAAVWTAFGAGSFSHSLIHDNVIYAVWLLAAMRMQFGLPERTVPVLLLPRTEATTSMTIATPASCAWTPQAEALVHGRCEDRLRLRRIWLAAGRCFFAACSSPGSTLCENPYSPMVSCRMAPCIRMWCGEHLSANRDVAHREPAAIGWPADACGKTVIRQQASCRIGFICRAHSTACGGRYDTLHDNNYLGVCKLREFFHRTDTRSVRSYVDTYSWWLPQYAATYSPISELTLYGNYGVLLSLGPQAPWWADNGSQFLDPFFTRQAEVGAKYEPGQQILLDRGAVSHARAVLLSRSCFSWAGLLLPQQAVSGDPVLRVGGPRDARRHRVERGRQGYELAAADCFGSADARDIDGHRNAGVRRQAGDQCAACCTQRCLPMLRCRMCMGSPDAGLELTRGAKKLRATTP